MAEMYRHLLQLLPVALLSVVLLYPRISAAQQISGITLPAGAQAILHDAMTRSGVRSAVVTRTRSSPADQVRIMYNFISRHGVDAALRMYGSEGDAVVHRYSATDGSPDVKKAAMLEELNRQLPGARSNGRLMHVNDDLVVFDLSLRRLDPTDAADSLIHALRANAATVRVLGPEQGEKEAIHVELKKSGRDS